MPITYSNYLKLDALLALQQPLATPEAGDELLFIVMHQTCELWFKQMLYELERAQVALVEQDTPQVSHRLRRIRAIFNTLLTQIEVLSTMSPTEFQAFRSVLGAASGFQSAQFRALEFRFGFKNQAVLLRYAENSPERQLLAQYYRQPGLWDAFLHYLQHKGYAISAPELTCDVTQVWTASPEIAPILLHIYRHDPEVMLLCEQLIDLDAVLQNWRYQHLKLAERMIGQQPGSGGTAGIRYLQQTLTTPAFPDLWELRHQL